MSQLPFKGDIVIGNDVWIGRESVILPGGSNRRRRYCGRLPVVTKDVLKIRRGRGNPARFIKSRFDEELVELLLQWKWWDKPPEMLADLLPLLCDPDLEKVRKAIQKDTATLKQRKQGESSSG